MKLIVFLSLVILLSTSCKEDSRIPREKEIVREDISQRDLPKSEVPQNEMPQNVEKIQEQEVTLGEATTDIIDTGVNRVGNIQLACNAVNGKQLIQGEEFSFNGVVGKRSRERGYKDAPVIFHGEKSYGTGGGICQVSSTLYMAALNAGMEITERHQHSEKVAYAPGSDATVVYGEKDFKFKNSSDGVIIVYSWVQNEKVYAKIIRKGQ